MAAQKYEIAKTWFDAKADKSARDSYVENWSAVSNAWDKGLANGKIGDEILKISLGLTDISDDATTEEVAAKIIKYLKEQETYLEVYLFLNIKKKEKKMETILTEKKLTLMK